MHSTTASWVDCNASCGVTKLKKDLIALLDENDMDQIVFKQWTLTDRSTLEIFFVPAKEFIEISVKS